MCLSVVIFIEFSIYLKNYNASKKNNAQQFNRGVTHQINKREVIKMDINYSLAIGIFGILLAIYQGFERKKLKGFVRTQSWHVYSMAIMSFGSIQSALKNYKEIHKDNLNPIVFEQLSKSDAYNVSLFLEAIRQIQLSEPKFNIQSIMTWAMQGKIAKDHIPLFHRMMTMDSPGLFSLAWQSFQIKIQSKFIQKPQPQQNTEQNAKPPEEG